MMDLPDFLRFTPAPVRARSDGWDSATQQRFVLHLARGAGPSEAARHVGRSKQTAYALRARPGAEGFAGAWDAAIAFARVARDAQRAPAPILTQSGIEMLLVPRFYRGRLIGFAQHEDHRAALRTLNQLDRAVERAERSAAETDQTDRMRVPSAKLRQFPASPPADRHGVRRADQAAGLLKRAGQTTSPS